MKTQARILCGKLEGLLMPRVYWNRKHFENQKDANGKNKWLITNIRIKTHPNQLLCRDAKNTCAYLKFENHDPSKPICVWNLEWRGDPLYCEKEPLKINNDNPTEIYRSSFCRISTGNWTNRETNTWENTLTREDMEIEKKEREAAQQTEQPSN